MPTANDYPEAVPIPLEMSTSYISLILNPRLSQTIEDSAHTTIPYQYSKYVRVAAGGCKYSVTMSEAL